MYVKEVKAISRGQNEVPAESWNEFVFEERIFTRNYQYMMVYNIEYLSENMDEIIAHVKHQFNKKREEVKDEKRN